MAKAGLKSNGKLKKGYKFKKGGGVVKVSTTKKKPTKRSRKKK
ncbi:hypothetical protein AAFX60_006890 [Aliivibrio fischeri]